MRRKDEFFMKNKRNEIYELKENIYSSNIEKSKLNERMFSLNENAKKVEDGYNSYKEISDRVDAIKSVKDVMSFRNVTLKSRIPARKSGNTRPVTLKTETPPTPEFIASTELKDSFNKLHYNDKTTLEDNKVYTATECKELMTKNTANSNITLYAKLSEDSKYQLQTSFCETMITAYPTLDKLREKVSVENDLMVIDVMKNAHYIPAMTNDGGFCALLGGDMEIIYKEKVNTGKEKIDIWHIRKKA